MTTAAAKRKGLLRISEVARAAGVSVPTIHFYIREGLLSPPVKTARNMAYYAPECVEEIRLIKELQEKGFLPLSVIRLVLQAEREGQDPDHLIEMRIFLDSVFRFRTAGTGTASKELSLTELAAATGVPASSLETLRTLGLLMPARTERGERYDDIDVRIALIVKELIEFGLAPEDLGVYGQYIEVIRNEVRTMHDRIHETPGADKVPVTKLASTLNSLKACLAIKVQRQAVVEFHEHAHGAQE